MKKLLFLYLALAAFIESNAQNWWHHNGMPLNLSIVNNPLQKSGYVLVFNDEFNNQNFNYNCWERGNYWHGTELQLYVDDRAHKAKDGQSNYVWGDGTLGLVARYNPNAGTDETIIPESMWFENGGQIQSETGLKPEDAQFTSAMFESEDMYKHGYFEMRCKVPAGPALWPAFWLYYKEGNFDRDGQEIDIFEILGQHIYTDGTNYHFSNGSSLSNYDCSNNNPQCFDVNNGRFWYSKQQDIIIDPGGPSFADDFYTFGLEWRTNRLDFYLNNVHVRGVEDCNAPETFMKIIANLAIAQWGPSPNLSDFPANFEIDYIRVYKKIEAPSFGYNNDVGGWRTDKHRRLIGDINGDGKDDIVGFGASQIIVSLGKYDLNGAGFRYPTVTISEFCQAQGWSVDDHPIYLADANGDGKDDIIGFGDDGVFVALSNTSVNAITPSFQNPTLWFNNFGNNAGGYNPLYHPRMVGDIDGDGMTDAVAFSGAGVRVAFSNGSGFTSNGQVLTPNFGSDANAGGWNTTNHRRFVADITGDGKDDIVGFGASQVIVAQSLGNTIAWPQISLSNFCAAQGWQLDKHPIYLEDADGDGRKDIVGFAGAGVLVARAKSSGIGFNSSNWWLSGHFGYDAGAGAWRMDKHIRRVGDVTGDGRADIVGFGNDGVYFAIAQSGNSFADPEYMYNEFGYDAVSASSCLSPWFGSWRVDKHPRELADYNGDGSLDVVAFGNEGVFAHVSPFGCDQGQFAHKRGKPADIQEETGDISEVRFYPNPASTHLNIEAINPLKIKIYSIDGKLLISEDNTRRVNISNLVNGVYLIHAYDENDVLLQTDKFIKQ